MINDRINKFFSDNYIMKDPDFIKNRKYIINPEIKNLNVILLKGKIKITKINKRFYYNKIIYNFEIINNNIYIDNIRSLYHKKSQLLFSDFLLNKNCLGLNNRTFDFFNLQL